MTQTVYVVDDNASAVQHNIITFQEAGFGAIGYNSDPLAALEELKNLDPDLISLDVIMPNMDGIELYRKLSALKPKSRFIFVTALAAEHKFVGHFAESIGANLFVPKPLSVANIQQALSLSSGSLSSGQKAAPVAAASNESAEPPPPPPPPPAEAQKPATPPPPPPPKKANSEKPKPPAEGSGLSRDPELKLDD